MALSFHLPIPISMRYVESSSRMGIFTQTSVTRHLPEWDQKLDCSGLIYRILDSYLLSYVACWVISRILEVCFLWSLFHKWYIIYPWNDPQRCSIFKEKSYDSERKVYGGSWVILGQSGVWSLSWKFRFGYVWILSWNLFICRYPKFVQSVSCVFWYMIQ